MRSVLRLAFAGPANASVWNWWPLPVWAVTAILSVIGITLPRHLTLSAAWWVVVFLLVVAALLFRAAYKLHASSIRPFPDMKIEALSITRRDTEQYPRLVIGMRIANREPTQRVALDLAVWVELARGGIDVPLWSEEGVRRSTAHQTGLPTPLHVEPQTVVPIELGFTWFRHDAPKFSDAPAVAPEHASPFNNQDALRLDVTDQISGQTIGLRLPGTYETNKRPLALERT